MAHLWMVATSLTCSDTRRDKYHYGCDVDMLLEAGYSS